ncbi:hypothetical protein LOTGIDRAFT_234083 [Lottia gigantea]|uniref:C2H2-type domain-containing protein n=1 Tax=Lottia gigantea TaxID=225164 RepID=V3ZFN7_LOTGI|nr:hypothetical protein LOTGIDRAFT_234083 [Lottia gigantea]ESO89978.1 hypothetical protein LOTGIDRAFT_234083 [Lottia gigantea]
MSSRRKGSNPLNRRSMNYKSSQIIEGIENDVEEESDDEQLTIPPDLFQDFLQLKTSTHLNTSQLMRKLIQDYSEAAQKSTLLNAEPSHSNTQSPTITQNNINYEVVAESHVSHSCPPPEHMDFDQPLDLSVEKQQNYSQGSSPVHDSPSLSMHLPTITMRNNDLPFIKSEPQEVMKTAVKVEPGLQTSTLTSLIPTSCGDNPFILNGIPNLIAVPFLQAPNLMETMSRLPGIPVKTETPIQPSLQTVTAPTPSPRGRKPGRKSRGGGIARPGKPQPGEMKIIAENTLFPGVYTSILKLPWSRRSRNKPSLTQQGQKATLDVKQEIPVIDSSMSIQSEVMSASDISSNSNNALLLPASSQTIMSTATSQSVMMVYPNASLSAVGKPVRRRGRPPKLPMLSHLLSEKKAKKMSTDTKVTDAQDLSRPIPIPMITESMPFIQCNPIQVSTQQEIHAQVDIPSIVKIEPPSPPSESVIENKADTNISSMPDPNGTLYQEMILSSKSLINVRPRRRQFTDIKKGSDFMWTSFKIKPRGGKVTKTEKRKKNLMQSSESSSFEEEIDASQQELEVDDHQISPNMFQELYHCKICNAILPADSKLSHQQEHRPAMLTCTLCKSGFVSYSNGETDHESMLCTICAKASINPSNTSIKSMYHKFACDLCEDRFKSFHAFNDHRHKVHGNEKITLDTHSCVECGKIFFTTKGLNHHMKTHMDKNKKQIIGNGSKLFQIPTLENTVENLESEICEVEDENFMCSLDECKQVFESYTALVDHIQTEHPESECQDCPWPGCDMKFTSEKDLKTHILSHRDEKPLKCDFCDYRCRQKNALSWHMRKHPEAAFKYRKYQANLGSE